MEQRIERVERLLGLILLQSMKGASKREKASQLSAAGFTNIEIADLLGTTAQAIAQYLYVVKKSKHAKRS